MKYLVTTFKIIPNSEIARDLLASIAAEAGFETFEESDEGMKGYVQESLFAADMNASRTFHCPMSPSATR